MTKLRDTIHVMANPHSTAIKELVKNNPGNFTYQDLSNKFGITAEQVRNIARASNLQGYFRKTNTNQQGGIIKLSSSLKGRKEMKNRNILIVGDLHEPFCLDDYLSFCQNVYKQYKCNHVIFIGDVIDNHYSSFHDADPDGMGALAELEAAIERLARWYKAFPDAEVCIGNHDRIVVLKGFDTGLSKRWFKGLAEVLNVPRWNFQESFVYDGVEYIHGEGGTARLRCMKEGRSVVQGHRHTEGYVHIHPQRGGHVFGIQVGTGLDSKSYAAQYARNFPSSVIACAVVLNNGKQPILVVK